MTATTHTQPVAAPASANRAPPELDPPSTGWLVAGIVGRTYLWFAAGCLLVTLVPMLFGWHAYVIQTGSMEPRIKVGDVVLVSPEEDPDVLLGHVAAFDDPNFPGKTKIHRVTSVNEDGLLVTKGDANPEADSQPVDVADVHGIGRLLVKFVGLPRIWLEQHQWLPLLLLLGSLVAAVFAVVRDREPEELEDGSDPPEGGATGGPDPEDASADHGWRQIIRPLAWRTAVATGLASLLLVPSAMAAFAATTNNGTESWTVPNWNYTTQLQALGPKIYYKLDDNSPSANAVDSSGNGYTGTYNGTSTNFTYGVTGALVTDTPNRAVTQTTANSCIFTPTGSSQAAPGPTTYSEIVWFKVANGYNLGGKLVGMENQRTTTVSTQYDRHIYMDGAGKLHFGVWLTASGTAKTVDSPASYNDGNWHMAASTMSDAGMRLYVDGALVASDPNSTSETFGATAYWRFGCGNLSGWGAAANWSGPNAPSSSQNYALRGSLDEVSIFTTALTASQIQFLYWIR